MARKHPSMYRVRASRHEKAARKSSGTKRAGHEEIASGYRKLARSGGGGGHHRGRKHHKGRKGRKGGWSAFGKTHRRR